jgi:HMG box factor
MPFTSLSIPEPSISWYRVLPKPTALLHDHFNDPFAPQNSSLLQHHVTSPKSSKALSNTISERRITVPSITYSEIPKSSPPIRSPLTNSLVSIGNAYTDEGPVTRKRTASLMEGDAQHPDRSPQKEGFGNQFCLCQPDPKIPRPRNGMYFWLCLVVLLLEAECSSSDKRPLWRFSLCFSRLYSD